ncbi:MAG: RsmD family RNA methyltransferase [Phycisphaerales bacterium]|nr:RsmD family RNA methyltransferase [Phycisphaerales bacterium]
MRIISGEFRGRRLHSLPKGVETRPIPDMVKEALFNLLRGHFEDVGVIDVFAGSGSVGLEAASQGASRVVCVERDRRMARTLEDNIEMLGCEDRVEVAVCDALGPATLARCPKPAHIVFMDPPYAMVWDHDDWPRVKKQFERLIGMLDETGYAIIRTPWPFYHRELIEDEGSGVDSKKAPGSARQDAQHTEMIDGEEMVEIDLDGDWEGEIGGDFPSDAELEGMDADADSKDGGKRKYRTWDISLEMEGAHGPETHVYGSTAIHLYMRKVEGSDSSAD